MRMNWKIFDGEGNESRMKNNDNVLSYRLAKSMVHIEYHPLSKLHMTMVPYGQNQCLLVCAYTC
jgi:hypothetical protein